MNPPNAISSCYELNVGNEMTAIYNDTVVHYGRVAELATEHGMFWLLDNLIGGRRLIDMSEMDIGRIPANQTA